MQALLTGEMVEVVLTMQDHLRIEAITFYTLRLILVVSTVALALACIYRYV